MSKNTDKWIGKRFGKLKVISCESTIPPKYYVYFNCKCDCGNEIKISKDVVLNKERNGKNISCGCSHTTVGKSNIGKRRDRKAKSKIGETHNKLTIIDIKPKPKNNRGYKMICKCECGNVTEQIYADLVNNKVYSCGCYGKEQQSKTGSKVGLNNSTKRCSIYKWHYIKEGKRINMRSGYEVMYAMILEKEKVVWEYEPKCFKLQNGKRYTPDFYLSGQNKWVDIKGKFKKSSKEKIKEFENMGYEISVIFIQELEKRLGKSYYLFKKEWKIKHNIDG